MDSAVPPSWIRDGQFLGRVVYDLEVDSRKVAACHMAIGRKAIYEVFLWTGKGREGDNVQFILGTFLFVVVVGLLDARLPWPRPVTRRGER